QRVKHVHETAFIRHHHPPGGDEYEFLVRHPETLAVRSSNRKRNETAGEPLTKGAIGPVKPCFAHCSTTLSKLHVWRKPSLSVIPPMDLLKSCFLMRFG